MADADPRLGSEIARLVRAWDEIMARRAVEDAERRFEIADAARARPTGYATGLAPGRGARR